MRMIDAIVRLRRSRLDPFIRITTDTAARRGRSAAKAKDILARADRVRTQFSQSYEVPRKAVRIFKEYVLDFYFPLHQAPLWERVRRAPLLLLVECMVYKVDAVTEGAQDVDLDAVRNDDYDALHRHKARFEALLRRMNVYNEVVADQLEQAERYVRLENRVTSSKMIDHDQVMRLAELRPTDVRLLHGIILGLRRQPADDDLLNLLRPVEVLADIGNDLEHYHRDVASGRFNVYAAFVELYGSESPDRIRAEIARYESLFHAALEKFEPARRAELEALCSRLYRRRTAVVPEPLAPGVMPTADQAETGSTPLVVAIGTTCVIAWVIAYFAIIYRGFADATFGMPITALAANLAWEGLYSFVLDPLGDYIHILSIPCFFIDLVIAWQVLRYGRADFAAPFVRKYFGSLFTSAVLIAFPIVYLAFKEFDDPMGEYTGFGINLMMSLLFVAMLSRRDGVGGQSMYIAIFKWLGTLFAYMATAVEATTTHSRPWPDSVASLAVKTVTHKSYPLTPLINVMYGVTFIVDIVYLVLLRSRLKAAGVSPWRRI